MSKYAKAIVSVIMSVLLVLSTFFGVELNINEETVTAVINALFAVVTPILVYFIPNK